METLSDPEPASDFIDTRKTHRDIILTGMLNSNTNPVFEIYRAALRCHIKGNVRREGPDGVRLMIEADTTDIMRFGSWLEAYAASAGGMIICRKPATPAHFNDFLILK